MTGSFTFRIVVDGGESLGSPVRRGRDRRVLLVVGDLGLGLGVLGQFLDVNRELDGVGLGTSAEVVHPRLA